MGENILVESDDGFQLGAYVAEPDGSCIGAVVVIQEIFGVNQHIKEVADGYASEGYYAIAPKLFDRVTQDIELGYDEADLGKGVQLAFEQLSMDVTLRDIQATINVAQSQGKVGVVGYCFGGLLTWLSACSLTGISAASSYYGGGVAGHMDKQPSCPIIMHFGELDAHIPMSQVEQIKAAKPDLPVHVYAADHGFNCNHRASFDETSSSLARSRTLELLANHVAS